MGYANYYYRVGRYAEGLPYTDSAAAIADSQDLSDTTWTDLYIAVYMLRGNLLSGNGNYQQAIDCYFKVNVLVSKTRDRCGVNGWVNNSIGLTLYRQQKYAEAKNYFETAFNQLNDCATAGLKTNALQQYLDNVALCFSKLNANDSALFYYSKALAVIRADSSGFGGSAVFSEESAKTARGIIYGNIAQLFVRQNKLDSAEILFKRDIILNGSRYKAARKDAQLAQMNLAALYEKMKRYDDMKLTLAALRQNLDTLRNNTAELGWRKLMAEYYKKLDRPARQLDYYQSYIALKDSLDEADLAANASDVSKEFKAQSSQLEIELLEKDNQLSHLYLWITISLSLLAIAVVVLVYAYYRKSRRNVQTLMLLNREISEQRDRLEFTTTELAKSNRERERILKIVAHDLRDPIGGAATMVNTVVTENLPPEFEKQNLGLVEKALGNSLTLINQLLTLELGPGVVALNRQNIGLIELAEESISIMQLVASKKGQKLLLSAPTKPLFIYADRESVERVLNNLVGNAIKFSPQGETINVSLTAKERSVLVTVKDNGLGIPAEIQADIFNIFSSTRRPGTAGEKSFGLGLSICRQIVEAHQGKIWTESEPGKGATFFVELPLGKDV